MSSDRRNPYLTVVAVWIISSFGLGLAMSFPIFFVTLFFVLVVAGCLAYKVYHRDMNNRDLARNLVPDLRRFVAKVLEDFGIVFTRVSAWWLSREAQVQREMAQERERRDLKREKLAQLERKRRARRSGEHPEHEDLRSRSREERTEG